MLKIFRRHMTACQHRKKGRDYRHCQCPIWVDGTLEGKRVLESLKMRSWEEAAKKTLEWEANGRRVTKYQTVADAWTVFNQDVQARRLSDSVLRKYKLLGRLMEDFAKQQGVSFVNDFDVELTGGFRHSWKYSPSTSAKTLERLRTFFRFAMDRNWIEENPAARIKSPDSKMVPTMPFTRDEMQRIIDACPKYLKEMPATGKDNGKRLPALVLLMRYSGLRVGDAVTLKIVHLNADKLFLYMQKTGEPVNVLLPEKVVKELLAIPYAGKQHFFWSGEGKADSITRSWQTRLRRLFKLAEIENGHPHRFRDSFAVELLLAGTPIEEVSKLLGHTSVKTTEKHYAPWNRARQEKLESHIQTAWEGDPFLKSGRFTPAVTPIKKAKRA